MAWHILKQHGICRQFADYLLSFFLLLSKSPSNVCTVVALFCKFYKAAGPLGDDENMIDLVQNLSWQRIKCVLSLEGSLP
jgi:hypothetical protein